MDVNSAVNLGNETLGDHRWGVVRTAVIPILLVRRGDETGAGIGTAGRTSARPALRLQLHEVALLCARSGGYEQQTCRRENGFPSHQKPLPKHDQTSFLSSRSHWTSKVNEIGLG